MRRRTKITSGLVLAIVMIAIGGAFVEGWLIYNPYPLDRQQIQQRVDKLNFAAGTVVPHHELTATALRTDNAALFKAVEDKRSLTAQESSLYRQSYQQVLQANRSFLSYFDWDLQVETDYRMDVANNVGDKGIVHDHDHHDSSARNNFANIQQSLKTIDESWSVSFPARVYAAIAAYKDLTDILLHLATAPHTKSVPYVPPPSNSADQLELTFEKMLTHFKLAQFEEVNSPAYISQLHEALFLYDELVTLVQERVHKQLTPFERTLAGRWDSWQSFGPSVTNRPEPAFPRECATKGDLEQGLTPCDRQRFFELPEGSELFPLRWFLAMENNNTGKPFKDDLKRFGLLDNKSGRHGLPIGITVARPSSLFEGVRSIGLNCAACHVGEIRYNGQSVRLWGAPGRFNIEMFFEELLGSAQATLADPTRLTDMLANSPGDLIIITMTADRQTDMKGRISEIVRRETEYVDNKVREEGILGITEIIKEGPPADIFDDRKLTDFVISGFDEFDGPSILGFNKSVRLLYAHILYLKALVDQNAAGGTDGRFGRMDAFGGARNVLFGSEFGFAKKNGPVSFPHLWNFADKKWIHWTGNTNSVLERNIGQALGLGAVFDPSMPENTTLLVENIHQLEVLARKLEVPEWPADILGSLDMEKAKRGQSIYRQECASCHEHQKEVAGLKEYRQIRVDEVKTDPWAAKNFNVMLGSKYFPERIAERMKLIKEGLVRTYGSAMVDAWEFGRTPPVWQTSEFYTAGPLHGIWATAPFLHNNSVLSLRELLTKPADRSAFLAFDEWEYDPVNVGLKNALTGAQEAACRSGNCPGQVQIFDTRLEGNANTGHDYGTGLSDTDKSALIEFLKCFRQDGDCTAGP